MNITYTTEDPAPEYVKGIRAASDLKALRRHVKKYEEVADDALAHVNRMTESDFKRLKRDMPLFRKSVGKVAERLTDDWGDIVMPSKMLHVSLLAMQFHAPWGTAYMRCAEDGWKILNRPKR